jgi:hypothetical protein
VVVGEKGVENDREEESAHNGGTPSPGCGGFVSVIVVVIVIAFQ